MPDYVNISIAGERLDVSSLEEFPIAINYSLENPENFQEKEGSSSFNVKVPATLQNQKVANSYHDPAVEDLSPGQAYRSHQPVVVDAAGNELLTGKAFLNNASHTDVPEEYDFSFFGGNSDWIIGLKEKTLYDFITHISFEFSGINIALSWGFDGTSEDMPYVFAPVRYRGFPDEDNSRDDNFTIPYMRAAISVYWLMYWGFKSLGYRIQSDFMDTPYFRKLVMPWTWGNFHQSQGTKLDVHLFMAKSASDRYISDETDGYIDTYITDTGLQEVYDNNNEFTYTTPDLVWEYKAPDNGQLDAYFTAQVLTEGNLVGENSFFSYQIHWFYVAAGTTDEMLYQKQLVDARNGANLSAGVFSNSNQLIASNHVVSLGDKIIARFYLKLHEGSGVGARVNFHTKVLDFRLAYFRIPTGGTISFANYTGFKKFKFLDFVAGVLDLFNISPVTDSVNKVVYIEPMHDYNVDGTPRKGFFNGDTVTWEEKQDLSQRWQHDLFSDYEKEVMFKYKADDNDGILKVLQDRNQNTLAAAKYLFPDRFKEGKKEHENRFFAATAHCDAEQFKGITGIAPQMVCIVPENISNTSNSEADNTFAPKICYYKGYIEGVGGWRFENEDRPGYPYMFSVNYKPGGELDPVLSYSDERIGTVLAKGLMKNFFSQRLAIMRNGQFYTSASLKLNDNDVNRLHREHKVIRGQRWELVQVNNYLPLKSDSTTCYLRKWAPVIEQDYLNSFPSQASVMVDDISLENDIKYASLKCLTTDIPK